MIRILIILLFIPNVVFSQELKDFTKEPGYSPYSHLEYYKYMPESSCGEIINYTHYSASFCEEYKLSEWTIHFLTPDRLGTTDRTNDFRQDPQLKGRDASLLDFYRSGYDRGHMVPAGDMTFDMTSMSESYYMTNMSPQTLHFNRGGWRKLESKIREWVFEFDSVIVITGFVKGENPGYNKYGDLLMDPKDYIIGYAGTVPVPGYFYKVFIDIQRKRSIAFVMPNQKITKNIMEYTVSIDYLECITGLDFFYKFPDNIEILFEMDTGNEIIRKK